MMMGKDHEPEDCDCDEDEKHYYDDKGIRARVKKRAVSTFSAMNLCGLFLKHQMLHSNSIF